MNFLGKPDSRWQHLSDEALLEQYRTTRDTRIHAELFCRYTTLVYGVCRKYLEDPEDAKDAVLQIFEKLLQTLLTEKPEKFRPWLYTVTKNHCLMALRKTKTIPLEQLPEPGFMENEDKLNPKETEHQMNRLQQAQLQLPPGQQECIRMFFLEEKSYKEITELTGYTLNEVKSHIQNGKRKLKLMLEKEKGGDYEY